MAWLLALLAAICILAYFRIALLLSTAAIALLLVTFTLSSGVSLFGLVMWGGFFIVAILLNNPQIRRQWVSQPIFGFMKNALPPMSQTEREALDAGTVWWDAELFSGKLEWKVLLDLPASRLSAEEQAFIDGPVEQLCAMLDDWDITHNLLDLPADVWAFIKQHKFFGMIIPKEYGGLDFSHFAHSEVVMKLASRSSTAAVSVMVPNSLGPAKLLLAYGTDEQKNRYLPKLATGEEIPCFALTGPHAGSDAGAMPDTGIVCRETYASKRDVLGIRLNWEKRYITLGPIATVLGLAFKLYDPDHLIGDRESIGITVALIPTKTPGVQIGNRHFALNSPFQNGPNRGKDVFIPMDWVIGGATQVGNGWKMLMQCLSSGRGISLPALSTAAGKFTCRNTGAYARIRKQFNVAIGEFEGVEEPLARMAGETYIMDAARNVTLAALDAGQHPSVISAIIKYELTERMRRVVNDGMDIQGGSGICLGPRNYLGRLYQGVPVSITVEGANILTRTMMIFGQGAVRCHPYIQKEMEALQLQDPKLALEQFDEVLFQHIGFVIHNFAANFWLGLTGARFVSVPGDKDTQQYYRQIARLSLAFTLVADFALLTLAGALKRKERISGRFADVLSNLYLCSAVLKHYNDQGCQQDDLPLLHWACQHTMYRAQQSLLAIFYKLPLQPVVWLIRAMSFPFGKPYAPPSDRLIHQTAKLLLNDSPMRDRLTHGIYVDKRANDATGRIEVAFLAVLEAAPVEAKLHSAQKQKQLAKGNVAYVVNDAVAKGIITQDEARLIEKAEQARFAAISVDEFTPEELLGRKLSSQA